MTDAESSEWPNALIERIGKLVEADKSNSVQVSPGPGGYSSIQFHSAKNSYQGDLIALVGAAEVILLIGEHYRFEWFLDDIEVPSTVVTQVAAAIGALLDGSTCELVWHSKDGKTIGGQLTIETSDGYLTSQYGRSANS